MCTAVALVSLCDGFSSTNTQRADCIVAQTQTTYYMVAHTQTANCMVAHTHKQPIV